MESWSVNATDYYSYEETDVSSYRSFDSGTFSLIMTIAYSISTLLIVVFNLINIIVIPQVKECFGENTKLCLLTLAVVDFSTGLICSSSGVIFVYVPLVEGVRMPLIVSCTAFVWMSMLILTVASVDRYIAVTRPFQYQVLMSRKRLVSALVFVTTISLTNSVASYTYSLLRNECHPFSGVCPSIKPIFAVYNILPVVAVIVTTYVNIRLVIIARRHERQIAVLEAAVHAGDVALPPPSGAGLRGLKTVLVLTAAFYIAWLPGMIVNFLAPICSIPVHPYVTLVQRYVIICNSWWNAAVYWFLNKPYRITLIKTLRRICRCTNNRVGHAEETGQTMQLSSIDRSQRR